MKNTTGKPNGAGSDKPQNVPHSSPFKYAGKGEDIKGEEKSLTGKNIIIKGKTIKK